MNVSVKLDYNYKLMCVYSTKVYDSVVSEIHWSTGYYNIPCVFNFDIFSLPEAGHFRPSSVKMQHLLQTWKNQHRVHISIFSRQKCHGLESGETSVENKDIFQPQLILIVTMQKIHNVDNDLLMFFPPGSNLFAWEGKTRHQYDFHF